jgi:tetratricopeptide (TPR) repeat protein
MLQNHIHAHDRSKKWLWILLLVGLPLTSATVWFSQSDPFSQIKRFQHQAFNSLKPPYRYPYELAGDYRNPTSIRQREIGFYQEQIRKNPQSGLDRAYLASAYLGMARTTGEGSWYLLAEQTAKQSLVNLPVDNPGALSTLARVAEARHDFAGALRLAEQINDDRDKLAIQTTSNLAIGNLPAASLAADQWVDLSLNANAFLLQALVRNAQGSQALDSFNYALEVEEANEISTSARIRTLLGRYYYDRGQIQLARDLYQEALMILPEYPLALINLAQLDIRVGRYDAALKRYEQMSSSGTSTIYDPLILRGKARIRVLQGDRASAETLWSQAEVILRQSSEFGHRRDLARLLLERGRSGDAIEAVSLMQREIKNRRDAETLDTYAWALMQTKQLVAAQKVIQESLASETKNPGILDRASQLEQSLGRLEKAQEYRQQLLQNDPQFDQQARRAIGLNAGLGG